ncbi:MAG: hypothetical protein ABIP51_10500 [Bacteroidia bacterium]
MIKTNIIVRLEIEGFHCWPQAARILPYVAFLSERHRHIFHFTAKKEVTHSNRDIEIIMFKREITKYLLKEYDCGDNGWCEFGTLSCEAIAEILMKKFDLHYCSVLEDNENGAECFKQDYIEPPLFGNTF